MPGINAEISTESNKTIIVPGLLGDVAQWVTSSASYPNETISLVASISFITSITGRAFNTYTGAGLNQYILLLAQTGMGKEAIANSIGKMFSSIAKTVPASISFKGPSHIASAQALIKWLAKNPSILCIFGEFGLKLKAMARNPSPNDVALLAAYLDLYSKSGGGAIVDSMAYSDKEKNTAAILSPSLSILGESVPGEFYANLDGRMIANGLLPRFAIFEVEGQRPYLNDCPTQYPPDAIVQQLADLAAHSLSLSNQGKVQIVEATSDAKDKFRSFERWTTDQINGANGNEVHRHLWNRANLKALKLASIQAVGANMFDPVIDINACMWATNLIVTQTQHLIGKFDRNEVGNVDGDEAKQRATIIRIIAEYLTRDYSSLAKYDVVEEMHKAAIVTHSYISRRVATLPAFANDRLGATAAIKRAVQRLLDDDELREVPTRQMTELFGAKPKAYGMSNMKPFVAALKI